MKNTSDENIPISSILMHLWLILNLQNFLSNFLISTSMAPLRFKKWSIHLNDVTNMFRDVKLTLDHVGNCLLSNHTPCKFLKINPIEKFSISMLFWIFTIFFPKVGWMFQNSSGFQLQWPRNASKSHQNVSRVLQSCFST